MMHIPQQVEENYNFPQDSSIMAPLRGAAARPPRGSKGENAQRVSGAFRRYVPLPHSTFPPRWKELSERQRAPPNVSINMEMENRLAMHELAGGGLPTCIVEISLCHSLTFNYDRVKLPDRAGFVIIQIYIRFSRPEN